MPRCSPLCLGLLATALAAAACPLGNRARPGGGSPSGDDGAVRLAERAPARELLAPPHALRDPVVPLRGSLREYLEAVVHTNGVGQVTRVRPVPCRRNPAGRCVEIHGEACPKGAWTGEGDCEGLSLTLIVDVSGPRPALDHGEGPDGSEIESQADIERLLRQAP